MKSKKELKSKAREIAHSIMKKKGYSKSRAYAIANANVYERVEQALLNSGIVSEEIVNPDNRGTMTKAEIIKRDRIARSRKVKAKIRATKGNDTDENARYRYATFITMMMRGGKKGAAQPGEKRRTKKAKKAKAAPKKKEKTAAQKLKDQKKLISTLDRGRKKARAAAKKITKSRKSKGRA
jgi:hypothetical protein